jgi:hypothetical protein
MSVFGFNSQKTKGSIPFPFFVRRKQMEVAVFRFRNFRKVRHGDINRKTEAQAIFLILLPFANSANGSLSFVRFLTLSVFTNGLNELAHLCL